HSSRRSHPGADPPTSNLDGSTVHTRRSPPMHGRKTTLSIISALCLLPAFGCSTPKPEPEIASSAPQGGYAESYPAELQASATAFSKDQADVARITTSFSGYPRDLKGPGKPYAEEIAAKADASGRSWAYVEALRETRETKKF